MRVCRSWNARARWRVVAGALALAGFVGALPATAYATPPTSTSTSTTSTTSTTAGTSTTTTSTSAPALPGGPPTTPAPTVPLPPPEPPPPPFEMGFDAGPQLMAQLDQATHDVKTLGPQVPARRAARDRLQAAWDHLVVRIANTRADVRRTEKELSATRERLQIIAANAYTSGGSARISAAFGSLLNANDVVDASRDLLIIDRYGSRERDVAHAYERAKVTLARRWSDINDERVNLRGRLDAAVAESERVSREFTDAKQQYEDALVGIARFKKLAVNSASPILGPNRLTADDLAAFVVKSGHHPHLSVPIEELAKIYIQESADEGVRGDVMWAQSILETGWFGYAGSMVGRFDNNFAGIGACDSCAHGFVFPDARTGVRAQVQNLKIYVDPKYDAKSAAHEIVLPGVLKLGFRGDVHSWWDLTGTWATARNYGPRVYDIYMKMVTFAATRH